MRPQVVTVGAIDAADADGVCEAQSLAGAGDLTIDGALATDGVATMDEARRIILTAAASDNSGVTFTVYGTNEFGSAIQASSVGPSSGGANVDFGVSFKTVTQVAADAATVGNVTVGTNGVADSYPLFLNTYANSQVAIQATVTGTVNYTIRQTLDNPNTLGVQNVTWVDHSDANLVSATTTQQGNYNYLPKCVKVVLNSGTGSVKMTLIQAGAI